MNCGQRQSITGWPSFFLETLIPYIVPLEPTLASTYQIRLRRFWEKNNPVFPCILKLRMISLKHSQLSVPLAPLAVLFKLYTGRGALILLNN